MRRAVFVAIPGLIGLGLSFFLSELLVERSSTAQRLLAGVVCPSGSQLIVGDRARGAHARGGGIASGLYASCLSPGGQPEECRSCMFVAAAPFALALGGAALIGLRAVGGRRPSSLDHLAQLDVALRLGALSPEQHADLKRDVMADPNMTRERFAMLMQRSRSGVS